MVVIWFWILLGLVFVEEYKECLVYVGGMEGYNVRKWVVCEVGVGGLWMIVVVSGIWLVIYVSGGRVMWLRKVLSVSLVKDKEKGEGKWGEGGEEFRDWWSVKGKKWGVMGERGCDGGREEERKGGEEGGKEEKDEDGDEIMVELGDGGRDKG